MPQKVEAGLPACGEQRFAAQPQRRLPRISPMARCVHETAVHSSDSSQSRRAARRLPLQRRHAVQYASPHLPLAPTLLAAALQAQVQVAALQALLCHSRTTATEVRL